MDDLQQALTPTEDRDLKMRCYNAMGHGQTETMRLDAAKMLYGWITGADEPKAVAGLNFDDGKKSD